MRFVCLGYYDEKAWLAAPEKDTQAFIDECFTYDDVLREGGHWGGGEALQPSSGAKTVRFQSGKVIATDGPYAETKEQIGGFLFLEAKDMNDAVELMSKHPGMTISTFEIRPVADMTEVYTESGRRRSKRV